MKYEKLNLLSILSYTFIYLFLFTILTSIAFFYNYLLFHSTIEIVSAVIAIAVFVIIFNTRKYIENSAFFYIIGIAFLFIGILDILHTLSYYGMGVFKGNSKNLPTQIWIISRYLISLSFLLSILFNNKKINFHFVFLLSFIINVFILLLVFYFKNFPVCFIDGIGLTVFKKTSEYIISIVFLIAIIFLILFRKHFDILVFKLLIIFLILSIFSEIFFTLYSKVYDVFNLIGHWLKLASYFVIYKIFVVTVLKKPYGTLFKDLKESKGKYYLLSEELKEKNNDLEQIIYIISHDIRTPMTNIQGFTKAVDFSLEKISKLLDVDKKNKKLKKEIDNIIFEEIKAFRRYIQASIVKIDSLISGLLHVMQFGRESINKSRIDLNLLIKEILNSLEYLIKKNNIKVEVSVLPYCMGDNVQINQVFYNILDNAIKYLDNSKQGEIKIWAEEKEDFNIYCVEDNGIGIDIKDQKIIFDIFKRVRSDQVIGDGLGLTIVAKILNRHKGKIWVESEKSKGSKFYFTLPKF